MNLIKLFDELNKKKKNKIAVGVLNDYPLTIDSLKKAAKYVDLVIVGPKKIPGFKCIETSNPEVLVKLAKDKKVDAVFRGNFDAVALYDAIHSVLNFTDPLTMISPMVVKKVTGINDDLNAVISMIPFSPSNDKSLSVKMLNIDANISFFESFGVTPRIGILSAGKPSDILEGIPAVDKTLTEAEFLVNWYSKKGYQAKHFNHQVEYAVLESEIVIHANAIAGNQGGRAMVFFGDSYYLGGIPTNLPIIYSQTAEAFRDWEKTLLFLNAYINKKLIK